MVLKADVEPSAKRYFDPRFLRMKSQTSLRSLPRLPSAMIGVSVSLSVMGN